MANKSKAKEFIKKWANRGDEKQDTSHFWLELLQEVYGDTEIHNDNHISFEVRADKQNKAGKDFKDVVVNRRSKNATLIEQKSFNVNLDHKNKQSNGELLTPFEQAKKYDNHSAWDDKARWIITCNFKEFRIYDLSKTGIDLYKPKVIKLEELLSKLDWLDFLLPNYSEESQKFVEETAVSVKAGELVGKMYDGLLKRYDDPSSEQTQRELNKLCVRLVFCLYADDAGLFDNNDTKKFENYIKNTETKYVRQALIDLFKVLDQKENERDKYLDNTLKSFPYVNGGLFKGNVEIPNFDDALKKLLVEDESASFDWSVVSPTIFGAVFESTLNIETRRSGGMYYTSIENIHKVIDPLFLDGLKIELNDALSYSVVSKKEKALISFQDKVSNLTFMDPACGSGNFLTETYLSLRRLENEVIRQLHGIKVALDFEKDSVIKVSILQFYGIEVNDFAVAVAKTALWIAESQMFKETESILSANRDYFPLKTFNNIVEGNALEIKWEDIISKDKLNYIMGNPPFIGAKKMSHEQRNEIEGITDKIKSSGLLDYVSGWYIKGINYIKNSSIKMAYVSTSSITQGEQVPVLWNYLFSQSANIEFAYRPFQWSNDASIQAQVYCVIICVSVNQKGKKILYDNDKKYLCENIGPYLIQNSKSIIESHTQPITNAPICGIGCKPIDGGHYLFKENEMKEFIDIEPLSKKYFYKWLGGDELINGFYRYCLYLKNADPKDIAQMKNVQKRIESVRDFRLGRTSKPTKKLASTPTLFHVDNKQNDTYIAIPELITDDKEYLQADIIEGDVIPSNLVHVISTNNLVLFSILESNLFMMWMKTIGGRKGNAIRFSSGVVYNNFPFILENNEEMIASGKSILLARKTANMTLKDLYNPVIMPSNLYTAHKDNDNSVMKAYGFENEMSESEIMSRLFEMYATLVAKKGK